MSESLFGPADNYPRRQRHFLQMTVSDQGADFKLECRHEPVPEPSICHGEFFLDNGFMDFLEYYDSESDENESREIESNEIVTWMSHDGEEYFWRYVTDEERMADLEESIPVRDCSSEGRHLGPFTIARYATTYKCVACGAEMHR